MTLSLPQCVAKLPEKYQPIYGHPELSDNSSRDCEDRLAVIIQTHDVLRKLLGRPLRVLDLGCAQGFFSLSLAALGATVEGIDFLADNVAVCNSLAIENSQLEATFYVGRIEDRIERLQSGEFDLVLGLSVFHHVIYEKGIESVKQLFNFAAECCGCLLLEIALKSEPLYWGEAQPDDPRELLTDIAFTHLAAMHSTHLGDIPRPMFLASNKYWILDGIAQDFYVWTTESHALAQGTHGASRKYFKSKDKFLKYFDTKHSRGEFNRSEFTKEIEFLNNPPSGIHVPKLFSFGETELGVWVLMERIDGVLLSEQILSGCVKNTREILADVLEQLCLLENNGLYCDDLRTWNVLIDNNNKAVLIDFGSIVKTPQDCVWPYNIFLSFFIFLGELVTQKVDSPVPLRAVPMAPWQFPAPYNALVKQLWDEPLEKWSFNLINTTLNQIIADGNSDIDIKPERAVDIWMCAIESAVKELNVNARFVMGKNQQLESRCQQLESMIFEANQKAQNWQQQANQMNEQICTLLTSNSSKLATLRQVMKSIYECYHSVFFNGMVNRLFAFIKSSFHKFTGKMVFCFKKIIMHIWKRIYSCFTKKRT